LDVIEICLTSADECSPDWKFRQYSKATLSVEEAILEINQRFRDHGVGFQFENGEIIRVDSKFLHQEAIRPALHLLAEKEYAGPNAEFLLAHEHYRHGRFKEAIVAAAKSFESVLKVISSRRHWKISGSATAKNLLDAAFKDGKFMPSYLQSEFTALRSSLESGVPTVRNNVAGHGQGENIVGVPEYLVAYVLQITASSIILLIKADAGG
jgi:hypothetical protein